MKEDITFQPRHKAFIRSIDFQSWITPDLLSTQKEVDNVLALSDAFAVTISELYRSTCKEFGISGPFTFSDFQNICESRGIALTYTPRKHGESFQGYYFVSRDGSTREIFINPALDAEYRLLVAAHELGHCLLHNKKMLSRLKGPESQLDFSNKPAVTLEDLCHEIQADTFAAMLVSADSETLDAAEFFKRYRFRLEKAQAAIA